MASCDVCGKGKLFGRHIRHQASGKWALRAPKKPRAWTANVKRRRVTLEGRRRLLNICTRCLRTLHKVETAA